MMRLILTFSLLAGVAQAIPQQWHVNPIGDARKAMHIGDITRDRLAGGGLLEVEIPQGKWEDLTFTYWMRHGWGSSSIDPEKYYQTVHLVYCPEPIQRNLPDALEGAGGWGVEGGVEVEGALIIPYEYALHWTYTNRVFGDIRDPYTHGVYSVNAICSAPMGLSLGGVEHTLQEGTNSFNSYGGWEDHVTITGSGNVQLGISQMYWHEYFSRINGVADPDNEMFLSKESIITNEMVFVSCRMKLNDVEHKTHDSMIHWEGNDVQGKTVTNSLPKNPDCRAFDSRGHYRVGLIGLGAQPEKTTVDLFDFRIHPWWLTDEDLQRTFRNGKEEMARRGIAKHSWTPAQLGPIAWYKGDGNALDAMGSYDGTWVGTEAYAEGRTGQAFDFNGSSQIGLGANFNFAGDASFSVSFWLDAERKASEEFIVSHLGYEINKRAWKITKFNQLLVFDTYSNGAAEPRIQINTTMSFESRRHVTVSVDGLYARIYIDGVLANEGVALPRYDTQGSVITKIGAAGSSLAVNKLMLEGKLDDVLIFDRALTAEEIELLYNESINKDGAEW